MNDRDAEVLAAVRHMLLLDREQRIVAIGDLADAIIAGRQPDQRTLMFLAGSLRSWLRAGGNIEKDFWRVIQPKSHNTVQAVWMRRRRLHQDEANRWTSVQSTIGRSKGTESDG